MDTEDNPPLPRPNIKSEDEVLLVLYDPSFPTSDVKVFKSKIYFDIITLLRRKRCVSMIAAQYLVLWQVVSLCIL